MTVPNSTPKWFGIQKVTVEDLNKVRDELLKAIQKGDASYRSGYVDGVLDVYNLFKKKLEEPKEAVTPAIKVE